MVFGSVELSPNGALSEPRVFGDLSQGHVFPVVEMDYGELTRTE